MLWVKSLFIKLFITLKYLIMEKFEKLEKVLSELNISDKELINWVNNRSKNVANKVNTPNKNVTNLIPTELPVVYRRGTKLDIAKGLDLNYKDDVWGIQLLSGVMISLRYEHVYQKKSDIIWTISKMRFRNRRVYLPSKNVLEKYWGTEEKAKFDATANVLRENGYWHASSYSGMILCSEEPDSYTAYYFDLTSGQTMRGSTEQPYGDIRVAFIVLPFWKEWITVLTFLGIIISAILLSLFILWLT